MTDVTQSPTQVVLFARAPILGRVKKRLAREVGDDEALNVHADLLKRTGAVLEEAARRIPDTRLVLRIKGEPNGPLNDFGPPWTVVPQAHESFGRNIEAAFATPDPGDVIILGADHPTLEASHLIEVAALLRKSPSVVAPTEDGGFWALAARATLNGIFDDVPLGTEHAAARLIDALAVRGLPPAAGPTLWDVDTAADLRRWRALQKK